MRQANPSSITGSMTTSIHARAHTLAASVRRGMCVLLAAALVSMVGCAAPSVNVVTEPIAVITIKNSQGEVVKTGISPQAIGVSFPEADAKYLIEVKPTEDQSDLFMPRTVRMNKADFDKLPADTKELSRRLVVKLDKRTYVNLNYVEVVLDQKRKWRGMVTQSRAFKEIVETGGAVPARVAELGDNLGIIGMAVSPTGSRIVYSLATPTVPLATLVQNTPRNEVKLVALQNSQIKGLTVSTAGQGGGIQQITNEEFRDMYPAFTPDGEKLLFASNRRRRDRADILRISAQGRSGISNIYVNHRDAMCLKPTEAVDGTIAFSVYPDNSRPQVWTTGGPNQFPTQITKGIQPSISPDGKRIAYIGEDGNLWMTASDGTNQTQLTTDAKSIMDRYRKSLDAIELAKFEISERQGIMPVKPYSFPSWSPDGKYIVFSGMEGNDPTGRPNEDVWIMKYDGSAKQQLTTNGSADRYPLVAPDRKSIYFMSNRGTRWAIWRIKSPAIMVGSAAP